jgi:hypothetical protein
VYEYPVCALNYSNCLKSLKKIRKVLFLSGERIGKERKRINHPARFALSQAADWLPLTNRVKP